MKILEKIYERLLREADERSNADLAEKIPARLEKAGKSGLALFKGVDTFHKGAELLVLYSPRAIQNGLAFIDWSLMGDEINVDVVNYTLEQELNKDPLVAVVAIRPVNTTKYGQCNNAAEVYMSAAKEGYGPFMYDIAMTYAKKSGKNQITSDRFSVDPSAENVWKGMSKRSDVESHPFVDFKNPENKDDPSACKLHAPERSSLNASYKKKSEINPAVLEKNNEDTIKQLAVSISKETKVGVEEIKMALNDYLQNAAEKFFRGELH